MHKIQEFESEISTLESEILKLRSRHTQLSQNFAPAINGSDSQSLVESLENAATVATERRRELEFTSEAIAILSQQLQPKLAKLDELKKQQQCERWQMEQEQLQPQSLEVAHQINNLSAQMDALCDRGSCRVHFDERDRLNLLALPSAI